ncbi:MAG: hypothetical protein AUK47_27305 [Deltaproteobacteria bacterium CG2_30_63_29]|nr:MAG: hypothetical protein AUK47_27305 [Deltaproteobacteria bacterium CG2_30_63_29]
MICVTGFEPELTSLLHRFEACERLAPGLRLLHELRLDAALDPAALLAGLAPLEGPRLDPRQPLAAGRPLRLVCCRPSREGGHYRGDEATRLELLAAAAHLADAVDVEADVDDAWVSALRAANPGLLVVRSKHVFDSQPGVHTFEGLDGDLFKLAVAVEDAQKLDALRTAAQASARPLFVVGMGAAGLLSRVLYPQFGAPWTYVAASESQRTAPGQVTLEGALQMGLGTHSPKKPYVLVGGPQVVHSPGWAVYNGLFRALRLDALYLPVVSTRPAIFEFLARLGVHAASVTMPMKRALYELLDVEGVSRHVEGVSLDVTTLDDEGRALGVVNSVRFDTPWRGLNTDVIGVQQPLGAVLQLLELKGGRAVILGAGGAAMAARRACEKLGLACVTASRAGASSGSEIPWTERGQLDGRVLINATPLSGERCPWPDDAPLKFDVVFDLALSEEPSALLRRADDEGILTLSAMDMWLVQGAAQMSWFLSRSLTRHDLARHLPTERGAAARRQLRGPSCLS